MASDGCDANGLAAMNVSVSPRITVGVSACKPLTSGVPSSRQNDRVSSVY